jgi:two-component system nitrate/nitrite response regulator NarL
MPKCSIIDDHPIWREGLITVLTNAGWTISGLAGTLEQWSHLSTRENSDLVIADLHLPDGDGRSLLSTVKKPVVIISADTRVATARECLRLGARGYLTKNTKPGVITDTVATVFRGEVGITAETRAAIYELDQRKEQVLLTPRESEIMTLICTGVTTTRKVAEEMGIKERTVKFHLNHIYEKTGLSDRSSLILAALAGDILAHSPKVK